MTTARARLLRWIDARRVAGVGYVPAPEQLVLCSYPKSGNTWMRFVVSHAVAGTKQDFTTIRTAAPDVYNDPSRVVRRASCLIKSHEPFRGDYRRVLLVVRDPRHVATSYFRHCQLTGQLEDETLDGFVEDFVTGAVDRYGTWSEHTASWLAAQRCSAGRQIAIVRYEDLRRDGPATLRPALAALGIKRSLDELKAAFAAYTSDRLAALERAAGAPWREHIGYGRGGLVRDDAPKPVLTTAQRRRIEKAFGPQMDRLGYLDPQPATAV